MAMAMVTAAMARKAEVLAGQAPTWNRGRSKETGREFYVVPASDGVSAHWTAVDGRGCTCTGHRRRGVCTHALAAALILADAPAPTAQPAAADDLGLCTDAELAETMLQIKATHLVRDADRAERAAYRARLRADLGLAEVA